METSSVSPQAQQINHLTQDLLCRLYPQTFELLVAGSLVPTFDNIKGNFFSKDLLASLTGKDAALKEVGDCIIINNKNRSKQIYPYVHNFEWDLHVPSGRACTEKKIVIVNVLREVLLDGIHATSTWGKVCMAKQCWCSYIIKELIVRSTERRHCSAIGKKRKSVIPSKQFMTKKAKKNTF